MPEALACCESLGDNCEFGIAQRQSGVNQSGIFRYAFIPKISDLIRLLDTRFDGLFADENLYPRDSVMVEDRRFGVHFHTDVRSREAADGTWKCITAAATRRAIFRRERAKALHCIGKTVAHLTAGTRLFVYKSNVPQAPADIQALLASLRRYGDNSLLYVGPAEDAAQDGMVDLLAPHLYEAKLQHLAPYGQVAEQTRVEAWRQLCDKAWRLHARYHPEAAARAGRTHAGADSTPGDDALDLDFYGRYYRDLATFNEAELAAHWRRYGHAEQRAPNFAAFVAARARKGVHLPADFTADTYRKLHPDLRAFCEHDWEYIAHYLERGMAEGRAYVAAPPPPLPLPDLAALPPAPPPRQWTCGDVGMVGLLAGTPVRTNGAPVPVEALIEGELLATAAGATLPVTWLGKDRYDTRQHPDRARIRLVRIARDALGRGLPETDLLLPPDQKLLFGKVALPAHALVNGTTITDEPAPDQLTCFTVALGGPGALLAAGVALAAHVRPARGGGGARRGDTCAPATGAERARVKAALLDRAATLGHALTDDPAVHLRVNNHDLLPERLDPGRAEAGRDGETLRFVLPAGATELRLLSRACVASWMWPDSDDRAWLGVAVARLQLTHAGHLQDLPLACLHGGAHPPVQDEAGTCRWTDGEAVIVCPPTEAAATLLVTLRRTGRYPLPPASAPHAAAAAGPRRILFISGEPHTPGHAYRVLRPVAAARALGAQASWVPLAEAAARLDEVRAADLLVIWRAPVGELLDPVIAAAREAGTPMLYDVDDLMTDPGLARRDVIDAIRLNDYDEAMVRDLYARTRAAAIACDGCITTTDELAMHLRELHRPVWVLPNGFDDATHRRARAAVRRRRLGLAAGAADGLVRIGYAGGSRTHQRDFAPVAEALGRLLRARPELRLVLFREPNGGLRLVEVEEYPALDGLEAQIEWRDMVDVATLPDEIARFDINVAPLEPDNLFCAAKSELKFFEAALAEVVTVASPTGVFARVIEHGVNGFLAATADEWHAALDRLAAAPELRCTVARTAYLDCVGRYGPPAQAERLAGVLAQLRPGRDAARAFALQIAAPMAAVADRAPHVTVPAHDVVFMRDALDMAEATVVIPVYNYAAYVGEAMDSVWHQTVGLLDLIVVDDCSTDSSLDVVLDWARRNGGRFNRLLVLRNQVNSGLAFSRNVAFAAAETPYVLPLDADNRLYPRCVADCLQALRADPAAAFGYPRIQQFGLGDGLMGTEPYAAMMLANGNYIDAMAMIARHAWARIGGYHDIRFGWEDFDLWCRFAEAGLWGVQVDAVLAEYRVHGSSMLRTMTDEAANKRQLIADIQRRHPWLAVAGMQAMAERKRQLAERLTAADAAPHDAPARPEPVLAAITVAAADVEAAPADPVAANPALPDTEWAAAAD